MRRKPGNPRKGISTRPVVALKMDGGVWSMLVNLGLFAWALNSGRSAAEGAGNSDVNGAAQVVWRNEIAVPARAFL